ncbi:hypothetical protein WOLCODRAFT_20390 [Wolfiporia cocos MD-104 SS10]|uniref:DDE-1 domain-containing protein n=1 Tax=Wolfiporia cocos (strain MD-104) TaxID=742152 RepID=A0A2H3JEQ7_WOLCO|nr:hypothetical protein WOLCODRAFT_20390 [Wolfiporia cocos MD-104 SS10]
MPWQAGSVDLTAVQREQERNLVIYQSKPPKDNLNFDELSLYGKPTNMDIHFFKPNMTSFVQPLDAGVIRCFKAHYCCAFCYWAIEQDEAREDDIYKIDQLEIMLLTQAAWNTVTPSMIANCWKHTFQFSEHRSNTSTTPVAHSPDPTRDAKAWNIFHAFASGELASMPQVEECLQTHLGDAYCYKDWKPAFDAVFAAKDDSGDSDMIAAVNQGLAGQKIDESDADSGGDGCSEDDEIEEIISVQEEMDIRDVTQGIIVPEGIEALLAETWPHIDVNKDSVIADSVYNLVIVFHKLSPSANQVQKFLYTTQEEGVVIFPKLDLEEDGTFYWLQGSYHDYATFLNPFVRSIGIGAIPV